jgi:hypothetical protein
MQISPKPVSLGGRCTAAAEKGISKLYSTLNAKSPDHADPGSLCQSLNRRHDPPTTAGLTVGTRLLKDWPLSRISCAGIHRSLPVVYPASSRLTCRPFGHSVPTRTMGDESCPVAPISYRRSLTPPIAHPDRPPCFHVRSGRFVRGGASWYSPAVLGWRKSIA